MTALPFQGPHPGLRALSLQHFVRRTHQQPGPVLSCRAAPALRGRGGPHPSQPGETSPANLWEVGLISPVGGRTRGAPRAEAPEGPARPGDPAQYLLFPLDSLRSLSFTLPSVSVAGTGSNWGAQARDQVPRGLWPILTTCHCDPER